MWSFICVGGGYIKYMRNLSIRKKEGQDLLKRRDVLDLKAGEFALLLDGRTVRCIDFYIAGQRRIPPEVWVMLETIEKLDRPALMRQIVAMRNKRRIKK